MTDTSATGIDIGFLMQFMDIPSVSPLEGGDPRATVDAQRLFAEHARARGFHTELLTPDAAALRADPLVPLTLREQIEQDPELLPRQPSVVARMGKPGCDATRRVVFNFHVDTVGPHIPARLADGVLHGRGALDDKGPGVALLAGVAAAFDRRPSLADHIEVVIVSVPGEEGGAMGMLGTKPSIERGIIGRLMVFAEPTNFVALNRASASMTWEATVSGQDSTDDFPHAGHNATLALSFLAMRLADAEVNHDSQASGLKVCLAGLHTGDSHNRVFGQGRLLANFTYTDIAAADLVRREVDRLFESAETDFRERFGGGRIGGRIARDWSRVVRARWLKAGLPCLDNRDFAMERVLERAGFQVDQRSAPDLAVTCDAIWAGAPDRYVVVCGPGDLGNGGAHTPHEHVDIADLEQYAARIADLVSEFAEHVVPQDPYAVAEEAE